MSRIQKKIVAEQRLDTLINLHSEEKSARILSCDLPVDPELARKISHNLQGNEVALGVLGTWVGVLLETASEALAEAGEHEHVEHDPEEKVVGIVRSSLIQLSQQGDAILRSLAHKPPPLAAGARICVGAQSEDTPPSPKRVFNLRPDPLQLDSM